MFRLHNVYLVCKRNTSFVALRKQEKQESKSDRKITYYT